MIGQAPSLDSVRASRPVSPRMPVSPFLALWNFATHVPLVVLFVLVTAFGARIFFDQPIDIVRVSLSGQILIFGGYGALAVLRQHFAVAAACLLLIVYCALEHLLFAHITGSATDFNAMASYLPALSFVALCESRVPIPRILLMFAIVALVYLLVYIFGYGYWVKSAVSGVLPGDATRATRLYLLGPWAAFVVFYGITAKGQSWLWRGTLIVAGCWAIWLSGSRTFQLLFLIVTILAVTGWSGRWVRLGIFLTVMLLSVLLFAGFLFPKWNPYELMAWDSSAAYRAVEYHRALEGIRLHWLLGVGLPSQVLPLTEYLKAPRAQLLFPSDLGPIGMALMLGIPGLLMFVWSIWFCTVGSNATFKAPEIRALQLTCLLCAAIGWLSPMLLVEPITIFLSMLVALHLRSARQRAATARAQRGGTR